MQDLYNILNGKCSIHPAAKTAAVTGSGVDLAGYEGATILVPVGIRTDSTFTCVLKESDDNSTYSTVDSADILGSQPTISGVNSTVYKFGYVGSKRYIRADMSFVAGGASAGAVFGAVIVRGFKRHEPTS